MAHEHSVESTQIAPGQIIVRNKVCYFRATREIIKGSLNTKTSKKKKKRKEKKNPSNQEVILKAFKIRIRNEQKR